MLIWTGFQKTDNEVVKIPFNQVLFGEFKMGINSKLNPFPKNMSRRGKLPFVAVNDPALENAVKST